MNHLKTEHQEQVSALIDGQVLGEDFERTLTFMMEDKRALKDWQIYHLVGDVMRNGERATAAYCDERLLARIRQELKNGTPDVLASQLEQQGTQLNQKIRSESANQANFYWKLTAAVASLMTVAVLGWQSLNVYNDVPSAPQVTKNEGETKFKEVQGIIRDTELDKLLEAHRSNGGISALQLPAGFMRNATFEQPSH